MRSTLHRTQAPQTASPSRPTGWPNQIKNPRVPTPNATGYTKVQFIKGAVAQYGGLSSLELSIYMSRDGAWAKEAGRARLSWGSTASSRDCAHCHRGPYGHWSRLTGVKRGGERGLGWDGGRGHGAMALTVYSACFFPYHFIHFLNSRSMV